MTDIHTETGTTLYCENHPGVETTLRCSKCNKPICPKCAVLTPTGYKCKECVRGQQKAFETAEWYDYPIAFIAAGILSMIGSLAASFIGFFIILLAPFIGGIIAEIVRKLVNRRRAKRLFIIAAVGAALGGILLTLPAILGLMLGLSFGRGGGLGLIGLLWPVIYVVLVTSTVYARLAGIQMRA